MAEARRKRKRWWLIMGLPVGLIGLLAALVPLSVERELTYCRRCGSLQEITRSRSLLWDRSSETIATVTFVRPAGADPCDHRFVLPAGRPAQRWSGLPGLALVHNRTVLSRHRILSGLRKGFYPGILPRLGQLTPARRAAVWRDWLDPDRMLPAFALGVFDMDTSIDSRFAVWTRLVEMWRCVSSADQAYCALDGPFHLPILYVAKERLREVNWDWGYYNPGATPPPALFGVDSYAPADAAEAARARALLAQALAFLGAAPAGAPAGADFTYLKESVGQEGPPARESKLVHSRYGGRFWHEASDEQWGYAYSAAARKVFSLPAGEVLPANFLHVWEKSLFAYTPVVHLTRALQPDVRLRHLGPVRIAGRRLERLLVFIADRFATLFLIDPGDGAVAAERRWGYTTAGQEMLTTWFSDWRRVDGLRVPFGHRTDLGGPVAFDGRAGQLRFDPWPLTRPDLVAHIDWQGPDALLSLLGLQVENRTRAYRRSRIEQWRWNPTVTKADFDPPATTKGRD